MRLGIDLDGVVADFNTGWIRLYNEQFDAQLTRSMVKTWNGLLDISHFETMGEFWQWARQGDGPSMFRHLDTFDGAVESLVELSRDHDIVIVTTKPDWAIHDTLAWLSDNQIPTREIHITAEKWRVSCDVYLDDSPEQVETIHLMRPDRVMCRFVRPWNTPVEGTLDVGDWPDFLAIVESLATTT
ncbi:MAG: hypothetical protein GXP36_05550 [Actinobacteria bacterium]|nr:hypothetical protein [Actinomycetota bacterium]